MGGGERWLWAWGPAWGGGSVERVLWEESDGNKPWSSTPFDFLQSMLLCTATSGGVPSLGPFYR